MNIDPSKFPKQSPYLKDRPFLVVNTLRRPNEGVRTERKGWGEQDANWQVMEQRMVVDRITPKIMEKATVIVDVLNKSLVKSQYSNPPNEVVHRYLSKYANEVAEAMDIWLTQVARKSQS